MFRLPVCPHCGTVYRYREVKGAVKNKQNACYHCKKAFRARLLPGAAVEAAILAALCIGFNILLMTRMERLNLVLLFAATLVFLLLFWLLIPFFVRFERIGEKRQKSDKNAKNGNRQR